MQMTCACRRRADDVYITSGVVLHEIRQLRQEQLCIKPNMASLLSFHPLSESVSIDLLLTVHRMKHVIFLVSVSFTAIRNLFSPAKSVMKQEDQSSRTLQ